MQSLFSLYIAYLLTGQTAFMGNIAEKESIGWWTQKFVQIAEHYGIDLDKPWKKLSKRHRDVLLYGDDRRIRFRYEGTNFKGDFEGQVVGVAREVGRLVKQIGGGNAQA